jgi:hypothetical protein
VDFVRNYFLDELFLELRDWGKNAVPPLRKGSPRGPFKLFKKSLTYWAISLLSPKRVGRSIWEYGRGLSLNKQNSWLSPEKGGQWRTRRQTNEINTKDC